MTTNFHSRGNYAPVLKELSEMDLAIEGSVPEDLRGRYLRNGPNPVSGEAKFWFSGEGMLHAVDLSAPTAAYRNRWVRTPWFADSSLPKCDPSGVPDLRRSLANTNVVQFAGRTLALEENSLPFEVDRELNTRGEWDFGGALQTPMSAHPKLCPLTGEMHFVGYTATEPYLWYHVADAAGTLVHTTAVPLPGPTMIHDVGITENDVVLLDLPVVMERMARRQPSFAWSDTYGARIGLLPRGTDGAATQWFEIEPCYIFHVVNCWQRPDGTVVVDAARYPELWRAGSDRFAPPSVLWRYELDRLTGTVRETQLDDLTVEFPRIDERLLGSRARWGYVVGTEGKMPSSIVRYDLDGSQSVHHRFVPGRVPGEPLVVPRGPDAAEDDAWLLTLVYDASSDRSDLVVLAADDLEAAPVATVHLPSRVPFGFHGSWIPQGMAG